MSTDNVFATSLNRKSFMIAGCLFASFTSSGCMNAGNFERWGGGNYGQGNIPRQFARAEMFDPYPFNDIGPEIVGGRPREFANPRPEAERNKLERRLPGSNVPVLPGFNQPYQPAPAGGYSGGFLLPQFGAFNSSMMPANSYPNSYPQASPNAYINPAPVAIPMQPTYQGFPAN